MNKDEEQQLLFEGHVDDTWIIILTRLLLQKYIVSSRSKIGSLKVWICKPKTCCWPCQSDIPLMSLIKSPKQRLETYRIVFAPFLIIIIIFFFIFFLFYYYYYYYSSSFFPFDMNVSTADLRNYWTEFHETWWSYRYMFLVVPKVFRFVVKGVKVIFLGV